MAKGLAHSVGEGDAPALPGMTTEEIHDAFPDRSRCRKQKHIVLVRSGVDVVVEMVDYETGAVGWQVDIQLEKKRHNRSGCGSGR